MPQNDEFHQRDDVNFDCIVYADSENQQPLDVSGATNLVGRLGLTDANQTNFEMVGTIVNGPAGHVRFPMTSAQSGALAAGEYEVQGEITLAGARGTVLSEKVICRAALPDIP